MDEDRLALAKYRLEKSLECLNDAKITIQSDLYNVCLNRSYYVIFHAARAIMALDGADRKKHSGVIAYFQQNYVKTGIFDKQLSAIMTKAFDFRQESDYEDFFIISHEDVRNQLENAELFYNEIRAYIEKLEN